MKLEELQFYLTSYGTAPLLWVANNNAHTYKLFKSFMNELDIMDDIKELVDFANAYTLITPLFELDNSHGNLSYKDESATVKSYE
jgi:hypothetical protein